MDWESKAISKKCYFCDKKPIETISYSDGWIDVCLIHYTFYYVSSNNLGKYKVITNVSFKGFSDVMSCGCVWLGMLNGYYSFPFRCWNHVIKKNIDGRLSVDGERWVILNNGNKMKFYDYMRMFEKKNKIGGKKENGRKEKE